MNLTPREQEEVEEALGLAVDPVEPSPELKASLMEQIASTPQLPPQRSPQAEDAEGPASRRARSRWFSRPVGALAAAAAAVALFAGGAVLGAGFSADRPAQSQAESLAMLAAAGDVQRATAEVAGGGVATLVWSLDQRRSAIVVRDLPRLPADEIYQLWYIGEDGPVPAGTFEADPGTATWRVLEGSMSRGDTVGVTVEPSGGSDAPTSDPIVALASA